MNVPQTHVVSLVSRTSGNFLDRAHPIERRDNSITLDSMGSPRS